MEVCEWVMNQRIFSKSFYHSPTTNSNYPSSNKSSVTDFSEYNKTVTNKRNIHILPYRCDLCNYRCQLSIQLKLHRNTHLKKERAVIDNCKSDTPATHVIKKPETIDLCLESIKLENLNSKIVCDICGYECRLVIQLKVHKRVRHGGGASILLYDDNLRTGDNFEKGILQYFVKTPLNIVTEKDGKISEVQKPNSQKLDAQEKRVLNKVSCEYCVFKCRYSIQLRVHKSRCHEERSIKPLIGCNNFEVQKTLKILNAVEIKKEINAINCKVVNDEIKNLEKVKQNGHEKRSSGKENEISKSNRTTKVIAPEVSVKDKEVLLKDSSFKLENFVNSDDKTMSSRKRKKRTRHQRHIRHKENCFKAQNVNVCKVEVKDCNETSLSNNNNLAFSCPSCTYKCKFSVELRIHENIIHRIKSIKIHPVPMNGYSDNVASGIKNCAVKSKEHVTKDINEEAVELTETSRGNAEIKIKTEPKVLEEIKKINVEERLLNTDLMFSCRHCNYKCNVKEQLRLHKKVLHIKKNGKKKSLHVVESKLTKSFLSGKCHVLLRESDKLAVKSHLFDKKKQKIKSYFTALNGRDEKKLSCSYCSFKCSLPIQMSVHKNIHNVEVKPRKSNVKCEPKVIKNDGVAAVAESLKRNSPKHNSTSDSRRKFRCTKCTYVFRTLGSLNRHILCHDGKPFLCKSCSFKTDYFNILLRHLKKHKEHRPGRGDLTDNVLQFYEKHAGPDLTKKINT